MISLASLGRLSLKPEDDGGGRRYTIEDKSSSNVGVATFYSLIHYNDASTFRTV